MSCRPINNGQLKWLVVLAVFLFSYLYIISTKMQYAHVSTDDVPTNSLIQNPISKYDHITNELMLLRPPETLEDVETMGNTEAKSQSTPNSKKVLLIGGAGYMGSYLLTVLQSRGLEVIISDKIPCLAENFNPKIPISTVYSRKATQSDISMFGCVIFFGGCIGRKTCDILSDAEL